MSNSINTLARALVFACSDEALSKLASDNPIHDNKWPDQKLSRDTVRMLSTFVHQFSAEWARLRRYAARCVDAPDWHEVGLVLAGCGVGYDDYGQENLHAYCQRVIAVIWPAYKYNAAWRLTKRNTLHLGGVLAPNTPNPKRRKSQLFA